MRHFLVSSVTLFSTSRRTLGPDCTPLCPCILSMDGLHGRAQLFTTCGPPTVIADLPFTEGDICCRSCIFLTLIAS